jgi:hypothetical protein
MMSIFAGILKVTLAIRFLTPAPERTPDHRFTWYNHYF